jgi:phosphoglycolate phosphatase-like HAD superfamily hydrolase
MLTAIVFDAEGTLIDCVPQILACWQVVLATAGHPIAHAELQRYSGMDGGDMLDRLLPGVSTQEKEHILKTQGDTYRKEYLPLVRPFPGVSELFASLRSGRIALGIATSCTGDELRWYDQHIRILDSVDAVACGDDEKKGKPHPDLYYAVLKKLDLSEPNRAMAVGDSPYDAMAAKKLNMRAAGVMTGGFTAEILVGAGCDPVLGEVEELADYIRV